MRKIGTIGYLNRITIKDEEDVAENSVDLYGKQ